MAGFKDSGGDRVDCRGWIRYTNGTLNDSYNVSSLANNGSGDQTISWATDFDSANYAFAGYGQYGSGQNDTCVMQEYDLGQAAGSLRIVNMVCLNTGTTFAPGVMEGGSCMAFGN